MRADLYFYLHTSTCAKTGFFFLFFFYLILLPPFLGSDIWMDYICYSEFFMIRRGDPV